MGVRVNSIGQYSRINARSSGTSYATTEARMRRDRRESTAAASSEQDAFAAPAIASSRRRRRCRDGACAIGDERRSSNGRDHDHPRQGACAQRRLLAVRRRAWASRSSPTAWAGTTPARSRAAWRSTLVSAPSARAEIAAAAPLDTPARAEALIAAAYRARERRDLRRRARPARQTGMGTTVVVALWHDGGGERRPRRRFAPLPPARAARSSSSRATIRSSRSRSIAASSRPRPRARAPNRNMLTRAVGSEPARERDVNTHRRSAGDLYLLCSDGLTEMLSDERSPALLVALGGAAAAPAARRSRAAGQRERGRRQHLGDPRARDRR